jgi:hypothetical protein
LHGSGAAIDRDQVREDVADVAVFGLNAGKNKAVDQDGEALPAGYRCDYIGRPSGLGENLGRIGMIGAINVADVVSPSG